MIGLGPVSLQYDSEEKGEYMGGQLPSRMKSESYRLDVPVWSPVQERRAPLAGWRNNRVVRILDSTHEECTHTGLPLRQGRKKSALLAAGFPTTASVHASAQAKKMPWTYSLQVVLTPSCSRALDQEWPQPGRKLALGTQR